MEPLETVAEVRRRGFMTGIELTDFPLEARMGHQVTLAARRRGAIIRPLGDVVVLMPPLSITEADLRRLVEITAEAIAEATEAGPSARPASHPPGGRQRRPPKPRKGAGAQHRPRDGGAGQRPRRDARGDRRRPPLLARDRLVPGALGADVDEAGRPGVQPAASPAPVLPAALPEPEATADPDPRTTGMTARSPIRNGLA